MKELIEKLILLEQEFSDREINVEPLFEAADAEEDENVNTPIKINAQALKIVSEKMGVKPQDLRITLSKVFRNQTVSGEGRQHINTMLKLLFSQQPQLLNRMK